MQKSGSVICGGGEVGTALGAVLQQYEPVVIDPKLGIPFDLPENVKYLHICFPFSASFEEEVKKYQQQFQPEFTIIHSTVPVGTSRKLNALHSPVVGLHPFLYEGIKTFTRFISGPEASLVADYFRRAGLDVYLFDKPETTELFKILDTTYYALCIEYTKEIKRLCIQHDVPFEGWTLYNQDYNEGYASLQYPEFVRPNLVPIMKPQGGHCTIPNCELLSTPFTELIKKLNE